MNLLRLLVGRRFADSEHEDKKVGWAEGVPAMGLDGLCYSSFGPEAALTVFIPLGTAGLTYLRPSIRAIVTLLAILYFSYRQTLLAHPTAAPMQ